MTASAINGVGVSKGRVMFPLVGTWYAELTVVADDPAALNGPALLEIGDAKFTGYATAGEDEGSLVTVEVVGGAGGLGTKLPAKQYNAPFSRRMVLEEALGAGGETLSPLADPTILDQSLVQWMRGSGLASDAVKRLVASASTVEAPISWRVLPDGTVWVGPELWPIVAPEHELESEAPTREEFTVAVDSASVLPGVTFLNRRVSSVEYVLTDRSIRATVRYGAARGGLAAELGEVVRREMAAQAFQAVYRAVVKGQNADGTLELQSTDERIGDMSKVPIRPGLAGVSSLLVPPKTLALVEFENGDEQKACVTGFALGSATKAILDLDLVLGGPEAGAIALALDSLVRERLAEFAGAFLTATPVAQDGGAAIQLFVKGKLTEAGWNVLTGEPPSVGAQRVKGH